MQVTWVKNSQNNSWFDFLKLDLSSSYFIGKKGVYVIWYVSPSTAKVIRLGSGTIGERLNEHRANPDIVKYSSFGQLKVAWIVADNSPVTEANLEGIEAFLAREYTPLIGDRFPNVTPISVNLIGN